MCEQKTHVIKHIFVKFQHSKREVKSEGKIWMFLLDANFVAGLPQAKNKKTIKHNCSMVFCDPGGIRTRDPRLRRALLYPAELPDQSLL